MTVDTLVAQQENDYSKTLMIVDKSSHIVQNNVNLVKNDVSEEYDVISNLKSVINFNKSLDDLAIILNKIPSINGCRYLTNTTPNIPQQIEFVRHTLP